MTFNSPMPPASHHESYPAHLQTTSIPAFSQTPQAAQAPQPAVRPAPAVARPEAASVLIVRKSFWQLGDVEELATSFDSHLIALAPRAEAALAAYSTAGERCVTSVLRAVEALGSETSSTGAAGTPEQQLYQLGAQLYRSGLETEDQTYIGHALVRSVRDSYSGEWSTMLGSSWTSVQGWIVPHLTHGANLAQDAGIETIQAQEAARLASEAQAAAPSKPTKRSALAFLGQSGIWGTMPVGTMPPSSTR